MSPSAESTRLPAVKASPDNRELAERGLALLRQGLAMPAVLPKPPSAPQTPDAPGHARRNPVKELLPKAKEIAAAYTQELLGYREIAKRYNCTLPTVQAILLLQHVPVRAPGRVAGKGDSAPQPTKITQQQREWLLKEDLNGRSHADIALAVGLSRERVRQICEAAGHPTRRSRLTVTRELSAIAVSAKREAAEAGRVYRMPNDEELQIAAMWARGQSINAIAHVTGRNPNSLGVQLARWRRMWPSLFAPRREPVQS